MGNNRKLNRPLVVAERHWHFEGCYTAKPLSSSRKRHKNTALGNWRGEQNDSYWHWTGWLRGRLKDDDLQYILQTFSATRGGCRRSLPALLVIIIETDELDSEWSVEKKSKHKHSFQADLTDLLMFVMNPQVTAISDDVTIQLSCLCTSSLIEEVEASTGSFI